jgi:hypothetical protein
VCGPNSTCFLVDSAACGEVCARLAVENETCGFHCGAGPCLEFPLCSGDLACVNNVCVKSKQLGAACGPTEPVPCSTLLRCTADPVDPLSTGTCQARVTGGACFADLDCPQTDFCLQGACTARRGQGQSCGDAPTGCAVWTTCNTATGTCVPAGKPNSSCLQDPGQDFGYCWIGFCNAENVCVDLATTGESCQTTACALGSSCDFATLMCVPCAP